MQSSLKAKIFNYICNVLTFLLSILFPLKPNTSTQWSSQFNDACKCRFIILSFDIWTTCRGNACKGVLCWIAGKLSFPLSIQCLPGNSGYAVFIYRASRAGLHQKLWQDTSVVHGALCREFSCWLLAQLNTISVAVLNLKRWFLFHAFGWHSLEIQIVVHCSCELTLTLLKASLNTNHWFNQRCATLSTYLGSSG